MLERAKTRALPVLHRTADVAPAVQACCGVCRSCMATNALALAGAAIAGACLFLARLAGRVAKPS